jgi:hypothetical protein
MTYGIRHLLGAVVAGTLAVVVAYGVMESGSQLPIDAMHHDRQPELTERIRCPVQPPMLDVGGDWVGLIFGIRLGMSLTDRAHQVGRDE